MSFEEIRKVTLALYAPAFYLERLLPEQLRRTFRNIANIIIAALVGLYVIGALSSAVNAGGIGIIVNALNSQIVGLLSIVMSVRFVVFALDLFSHSFFMQDLDVVLEAPLTTPTITVEAAQAIVPAGHHDPLSGFLGSEVGLESLFRLGIMPDEAATFDASRQYSDDAQPLSLSTDHVITLPRLAEALFDTDKEFSTFLFKREVNRADFLGAVSWVAEIRRAERKRARWWSRDELGRIPGIGKDWAYGEIFYLEKYAREMLYAPVYKTATSKKIGTHAVEELETILARARESNAIIVGEEGSGVMDIVARFTREIQEGKVLPSLEGKRVFLLSGESLVASAKEKGIFEEEFIQLMNQTVAAGNIILVVDNLPGFMESAEHLGVNVIELFEPYLQSPGMEIIATATPSAFHGELEKNGILMESFEVVHVREAVAEAILDAVKKDARMLERRYGVFLTYQALLELIDTAEQFIPYGVMPDKAVDLLEQIIPDALLRKKALIEKNDVQAFVSKKTGVPIGDVTNEERGELMDLEQTLESRILGQPEAVKAVASAMRRARAGTRSEKRPMGTFLFLGPTGVGKTETAKVLAELFFKKDDAIIRIEMPEYSGEDAIDRLIGSFEGGQAGILSSALKERPYGVLLLNEFEKTSDKVLNLFLTILDEGQFFDANGKRVDARNVIIIATSNAGADLIWDMFKKKENPAQKRDELVNTIIERGIFKPELVNRFDGVVVFNPLSEDIARKIARIRLQELAKRLLDKGVEYVVTDPAIEVVVREGYNPEFGARAMARAVTERIEQVIADRMIRGDIKAGDKVELTEGDLGIK